jgi:hypothetical protein
MRFFPALLPENALAKPYLMHTNAIAGLVHTTPHPSRVLVLEGMLDIYRNESKKLAVEQPRNRKMLAINKFKLAANLA